MEVKKVYSINIVYFDLGQGTDYVYHGKVHFKGLHKRDELHLSASQRKVFGYQEAGDIYPEYYILKVNNFDDVAKDRLDEWIYFLKHNAIKDNFKAKGLEKAREILACDELTVEERREYDYLQDIRSENLSMIASAKDEAAVEFEEVLAEKKQALAEKDKALAEKDKTLAEKDKTLVEKDKILTEKDRTIAHERAEKERILAELADLKAHLNK